MVGLCRRRDLCLPDIRCITIVVFMAAVLTADLALGDDHYYDFVLTESNFTRLCTTKSMMTVNGSFPGPVLRVRKGDRAYVNVFNEGIYGVTVHCDYAYALVILGCSGGPGCASLVESLVVNKHGVKNPRNPWFDGPEYITQCPIAPGTNFTYQIIFSTEEGTLWWHAHSDWSRATIHGAIIIEPAIGTTYPFAVPDEEHVIVFASWYNEDVMSLLAEAMEEGGLTTLSDAYTINGQPGDFYNCSKNDTFRISVDYGKTYLLRLVNSVQNTDMFFAIADHDLTLVGWDASYVKPYKSSYILITPGQTMDVLVTADKPLDQYYILASPYFDGQADDFDKSIASAVFEYNGNYTPPAHPVFANGTPGYYDIGAESYFVQQLRSLNSVEHPVDVPTDIDTRMFITVSISMLQCPNASCEGPDGNRIASALNNITFANPSVDILQAYYKNISGYYTSDFPDQPPSFFNYTSADLDSDNVTLSDQGTRVKVLEYNETVEIIFQGTNVMNSGENHPMHLHGFRFYLVGQGMGIFDNETDPQTYNLVDPPEANTIPIPKDGWAVIRFRADNPGVWFMHCHFDRHMTWGMDTVFIVKNGNTTETSILDPPAYMPPCSRNSLSGALGSILQQTD